MIHNPQARLRTQWKTCRQGNPLLQGTRSSPCVKKNKCRKSLHSSVIKAKPIIPIKPGKFHKSEAYCWSEILAKTEKFESLSQKQNSFKLHQTLEINSRWFENRLRKNTRNPQRNKVVLYFELWVKSIYQG